MRRAAVAVVAVVMVGFGLARAQDSQTLHEYVPDVEEDEGTLVISGGPEPAALIYDNEVLPAPEGGVLTTQERAMSALPGDGRTVEEAGRRSPTFAPDRVTDLRGTIGYYSVFTPSIAPFKRVTALNRVNVDRRGTPILAVDGDVARPVELEGTGPAPDGRARDRFWGSVVLDFSHGSTVPFPSIAPDSRLLTVRTEPPVVLSFERDGADNLYAVAVGSRPDAQVRVVFLMDAPRSYFGGDLPALPADALASRVPRMPADVRRQALLFAGELGLRPGGRFDEVVTELTRHFRSFEESAEPPRNTGKIYLDLSRGMRGICRHRAYGFVITAQALGIHARFVQNEAHAWAEVERPGELGWLRVDLGGAATGLEPRGEARPEYRSPMTDRLPRPEPYVRAYEEAARLSGVMADVNGGQTDLNAPPSPDGAPVPGDDGGGDQTAARPTSAYGQRQNRRPLLLTTDRSFFDVFRGRELEVTGRVSADGAGRGGLRIEVLLRAPRGQREELLGVTVTGGEGRYRGVFGVPPDLPVGDYELVVRTPGDAEFGPAEAR